MPCRPHQNPLEDRVFWIEAAVSSIEDEVSYRA
jgi:hypothetical protein